VHLVAYRRDQNNKKNTPEGIRILGFHVGRSGKRRKAGEKLLVDVKARGLAIAAELANRDGHFASGRLSRRCRRPPGTTLLYRAQNRQRARHAFPNPSNQRARLNLLEIWRPADRGDSACGARTFAEIVRDKYTSGHLPYQGAATRC